MNHVIGPADLRSQAKAYPAATQAFSAVQNVSQVEEALHRLEKQATALRELVCSIATRLEPVLTPSGASGNSDAGKEARPLPAPLVSKIDGLTEFLHSSFSDLQEIDRRLAL